MTKSPYPGPFDPSENSARVVKLLGREPSEAMLAASNREWDGRMSARSAGVWQAMWDAAVPGDGEAIVEAAAQAIFYAENGIDGDTIGTMIHGDFRIKPDDDNCGVHNALAVCRIAARAVLAKLRGPS